MTQQLQGRLFISLKHRVGMEIGNTYIFILPKKNLWSIICEKAYQFHFLFFLFSFRHKEELCDNKQYKMSLESLEKCSDYM